MKIALVCQSLLLSKALHRFLREYIVPYKQCDFVITDRKIELDKPLFFISHSLPSHLQIPFSKSTLILALDAFYKTLSCTMHVMSPENTPETNAFLEEKIAVLTEKFRQELIQTLREYYGN